MLEIALDYRQEFHKDVVIDLIGFRRHGHNEGDEPTYTQPLMYRAIEAHPGVKTLYARRLVRDGVVTRGRGRGDGGAAGSRCTRRRWLRRKEAAPRGRASSRAARRRRRSGVRSSSWRPGVPRDTLARIGRVLTTVPAGFHLNPKMVQQLARRAKMAEGAAPLDWGTAEALAFGSLLLEGTPIRISGQDSSRGTFSQRHAVLVDTATGRGVDAALHPRTPGRRRSRRCDSPLSEFAVLGFDYGYSVEWPEALVLWEAQFGDFANGAQVIIDQFIASAEDKWRQTTRHGDAAAARLRGAGARALERAARALPAALRRREHAGLQRRRRPRSTSTCCAARCASRRARPLILFTPKSLLRLPAASSPLDALTSGGFRVCLDDPEVADRSRVERVLLCSGKVYYDLRAEQEKRKDAAIAIVRVEQLYPFPAERLRAILAGYPDAKRAVWVQEEPRNMGGWSFVKERVRANSCRPRSTLEYVGRAASPSPATGTPPSTSASSSSSWRRRSAASSSWASSRRTRP